MRGAHLWGLADLLNERRWRAKLAEPRSENEACSENQIRFSQNHFRFSQNVVLDHPLCVKNCDAHLPNRAPVLSFWIFRQSLVSTTTLWPTGCSCVGQSIRTEPQQREQNQGRLLPKYISRNSRRKYLLKRGKPYREGLTASHPHLRGLTSATKIEHRERNISPEKLRKCRYRHIIAKW